MANYILKRVQFLPMSLDDAWEFFSNPANLNSITPAYMKFMILANSGERMYPGQIISYTVRPVLNIPLFWVTEITHVKEKEYFIDEQRRGPYAFWHHTHFFKSVPGGVEMTDLVHYRLPFGFLGRWFHRLFVKKQLNSIFDYRYSALKSFNRKSLGQ